MVHVARQIIQNVADDLWDLVGELQLAKLLERNVVLFLVKLLFRDIVNKCLKGFYGYLQRLFHEWVVTWDLARVAQQVLTLFSLVGVVLNKTAVGWVVLCILRLVPKAHLPVILPFCFDNVHNVVIDCLE